jgi:hypothetical protein
MHPLILTATPNELAFIASLDYGQDKERHYEALNDLIFKRHGKFRDNEYWFPLEVIELGANAITQEHEREFVICCLLLLDAIDNGFCHTHDKESKFSAIEPLLGDLPNDMSLLLLNAYASNH